MTSAIASVWHSSGPLSEKRDLYYGGEWSAAKGGYRVTIDPGIEGSLGPCAEAWINNSITHSLSAPFGGYKQSGIGREESIEELLAFTHIKNIHIAL